MKRVNNLYYKICDLDNIIDMYNKVRINTKNKLKIERFNNFYSLNLVNIKELLCSKKYNPGRYNIFLIKEPKYRIIMSQSIKDKVVNHLVSKYFLVDIFDKTLINQNCATRIGKGTHYALRLFKKYYNECTLKYKNFYILKFDISKYFYNIDHEIVMNLIKNKIKDKDVLNIIRKILDSTDEEYVNNVISRLKEEGNKSVTNCHQLKLKSSDGKYYNTDVVDIEGMFRIIESIPSKNAEPIKQWLARLGSERIDEVFDPSISVQRSIDLYRSKGFDEKWITERIKGIQNRKELTDIWRDNGIESNFEYAILTNEIYKEWSGMTAKQYKNYKGLRKESLRDNMTRIEELLADLGEEATKELAKQHKPIGLEANKQIAKLGGHAAKSAKDDLEKNLGKSVVTSENNLNYEYIDDKQKLENK